MALHINTPARLKTKLHICLSGWTPLYEIQDVLSYIFKIAFPTAEHHFSSSIGVNPSSKCDLLVVSHTYRSVRKQDLELERQEFEASKTRPYICFSGESYAAPERFYPPIFHLISSAEPGAKFIHLPYVVLAINWYRFKIIKSPKFQRNAPSLDRKLLAYCYSNCVPERERLFHAILDADRTGTTHALCRCSKNTNRHEIEARDFTGPLLDVFKEYHFVLCPENKRKPGYVTEKIVQAFASGSIPVLCIMGTLSGLKSVLTLKHL